MTSSHPPGPADSVLDSAVALVDELLAAGVSPDELDLAALPDEVRAGVTDRLSCLLKLRALAGSAPDTPSPDRTPTDLSPADEHQGDPRRFGRFTVERELGRGGYGIVYLAHDPRLGRPVALKVPRREVLLDPATRDRLRHEARAAALLDHPNIVPVFEAGTAGPVWYVVSAYCPGVSLGEWLAGRRAPVSPDDAARLLAAVADGVQHAHARGILHRDLKPANILLESPPPPVHSPESGDDRRGTGDGGPGTPRVTDFGLSKILAGGDGEATRSGALVGTPLYMAPEQAEGRARDVTAMTDVWALGLILYELLTGRTPFPADTPLQILRRITTEAPVGPRSLRPDVPRDLEAVCLKCLEKTPTRRYPSAQALADDLRRFLGREPVRARRPGPVERARRWAGRHPARALAAALIVVLPTAAALGIGWHNRKLQTALTAAETAETEAGRRRAEAEARRQTLAETVDGVLVQMDELVRDLPQTDVGRRRVYEQAGRMSETLRKLEADNPNLRRSVARVHLGLAAVATMVDDFPAAARALDEAEPGIREWAAEAPDDLEAQSKLVNLVRARWFIADRRKDPRARDLAHQVEAMTAALAARHPDRLYLQNWLANALLAAANADAGADPPPLECADRYRRAIDILRRLEPKVRNDNPEARFERATTVLQYGDYLRAAGKPAEAAAAYSDVLNLLGDGEWYPQPRPHHRFHQALALRRWGGLLVELGEPVRAAEQLTQAVDLLQALAAADPKNPQYPLGRLDALAERALARWSAGRAAEARTDAAEAVRKLRPDGLGRPWRAKVLWVLGESARREGDAARAREHFTEALACADGEDPGPGGRERRHVRILVSLSLGDLARAAGDPVAAAGHYRAADGFLAGLTRSHPELSAYQRLRKTVSERPGEAAGKPGENSP